MSKLMIGWLFMLSLANVEAHDDTIRKLMMDYRDLLNDDDLL